MHFVILFFLLTLSLSPIFVVATEKAIVLPLNDWSSQRLLSKIVGAKIEALGYQVEYLPISSADQMGALIKGIAHLQVELWQSNVDEQFRLAVKRGYIEDLGLHSAFGREDWWYPDYVEEQCPGLPDWQALNRCAVIFSSDGKSTKGIYYTGPWNYRDADLIRALGLNFTIVRLENGEQIWQKLLDAEKSKQAIVLLNWTPNGHDIDIKGKFVEFPSFDKSCEKDPLWGVNKEMLHDCGNPKVTYIKKAAWPGLKKQWPCVYQLIKRVNFTTEMISFASSLSITASKTIQKTEQDAMKSWLELFEQQSQSWLDFRCPKPNK